MRLIVQGLLPKGKKRTVEMMEIILIIGLLIGGVLGYEMGKERTADTDTIHKIMKERVEQYFVGSFFPVLDINTQTKYESHNETIISKLISYPMPLYAYLNQETSEDEKYVEKEKRGNENALRQAYIIEDVSKDMLSLLEEENGFQSLGSEGFVKNTEKINEINYFSFETTEEFVENFYTVDSVTKALPELFDVNVLSSMDMTLKQGADKPQILIYHTHSQEAFLDSNPGDLDATIVGAGELLAKVLRDEYGYNVLHHTGEYDVPNRDYAYSKSLPALEKILSENDSIEVVIDLHRDGVAESTHLVTDLNGVQTAKIMFFNGLSYTKKNGAISYLENKNLQENLAFSFQMQSVASQYYPGLTRKNYLNGYRYNMHLRGKSLLIELGAQTNTVEEIKNAIGPLAHVLDMVLSGSNT